MDASSQPGDARAAGAQSPKEHALLKDPGATPTEDSAFTDGKNPSKPPYPAIRIPLFPSYEAEG